MAAERKSDKLYSKTLALQAKQTRAKLAQDEKSQARNIDEPGGWTDEGFRKHPYHKSSWGPYPAINISKEGSDGKSKSNQAKVQSKLMYLKDQTSQSKARIDKERSVGNISIRNVLERLEKKSDKSSHYRTKTITLPLIIRYLAKYSLIWEAVNYLNIITTCLLTAFYAFFCFYEKDISGFIKWMDLMFAADTFVRLIVEIWRCKTAATVVVFTAPYTMLQFLLDLISMAPCHYIYYWIEGSQELDDISYIERFTINRFMRLYRCYRFFETLERQRMVNEKLLFLFKFSNYYFGFIIFTTCLLIFSVGATPMDYVLYKNVGPKLKKSYLSDFQKNKKGYGATPWDIFVITLNFATAVITTVGYGDVVPNNELEMAICIFCMLFGAIFLNGQFTGELTNFEVEIDGARFDLYYRVREIKNYLISIKTRPFFNSRVEDYYNYLWTYREGVFDVSIMRAIPQSFHEELLFDICKEMFDKSYLFFNLDPSFLRALSKISTIALYNSNMVLCRKGKHACKLFYILQGECHAQSKLNPANPSAVIRAGSIIGETNLIFSYPYTTTVETRTCCQFIILTKFDFFEVIDQFPVEFEIVRSRSMAKIKELHITHQAYGVDPVCWVKARTDLENPSKPNAEKLRRNMRWATGLNQEVVEDVVDDSEENVIFSTPCSDPSVTKDHLIPYISCAVPEIMKSKIVWIKVFNLIIMCISLWFAFFGPYCLVFGESTKMDWYVCRTQHFVNKVISLIYIADVFVEIIGACPVAGWYYKFWDGLHVVIHRSTFYLDVLAALPLDIFNTENQGFLQIIGTVFKVLKMWKVIRFLHYLDEVYPLQLFWFRLGQTIIVLIYGIHFIACISYTLACPYNKKENAIVCSTESWLGSYETSYEGDPIPTYMKATTLGYDSPYLYSFFYSAATLTSAGFGDFNPQNRTEMLWAIGFMLFGFYLIGYYTSVLTSALSCLVRPKLALQQRLVSLCQFMDHYHLRENLKDRIVEYVVLQHQFRGGVSLDQNKHIMYDAPAYLRNDVLYLETHELLDGVPIFSKLESEIMIKLSSALNRFIIPPNTTFTMKGEVRRILYIIKHGSMGVFEEDSNKPSTILESTCHFGLRDLLFGEPYHHTYRSLSYVALYSIKRKDFEECLQYEEEFWELVNEERQRISGVIYEMTMIYSNLSGTDYVLQDKATRIPSWVVVPNRLPPTAKMVLGQVNTKMIKQVNLLNDEYDSIFKQFKGSFLLKLFLLRQAVHPVGYFSKFWNCLMSLISCLTVITLTLETFCYLRMPWFRVFQIILDWFNYMDIYLKFHWSYFNPHNGMLITHPMKTATNYVVNGSLVFDIAICAPMELLMFIFKLTTFLGYGKAASWYSRLRWIRFFQFKRIPIVFQITHDIFKNRNTILLVLYIISTLFVCTIVSAIAQFIACPWEANDWVEGDEYRIPICHKNSWVAKKFSEADQNPAVISGVFRRWILGLYYVSQVILVIGFGDMITLNQADILLLIFMCVFGFLFMRCVIADMTAAEVDSDEARAVFVENMAVLDLVMTREKVPKKLVFSVASHLRYTWSRSRGLQPRELFGELHPALESELYRNLIGDKLQKVPVFRNFPPTVLSSLCRYMKTQYLLRGNRIMRFGNLEYEMCIINHGKIYITDRHLNYICSLGPGDSFGESSVIYGIPRKYNAIAATNLEVYVLSAAHYENFLGRYPNFRSGMIRNLSFERVDYFERVIQKKMEKARALNTEQKTQMLHTFEQRTDIVKQLIILREDLEQSGLASSEVKKFRMRNWFVGLGDLDDNLPLLYLTYNEKSRKGLGCRCAVIHPNCLLIRMFINLISWLCFLTPAIAAYEVCFSKEFLNSGNRAANSSSFIVSMYLHKLSEVIEWIFLFYISLQFFLAYEIKPGVYNKSFYRIFLRYVTAPDGLMYDLAACSPFIIEKIFEFLKIHVKEFDSPWDLIFLNMSLLRTIRLYQYFKTQLSKKNDLDVSTFKLQITLSVTSFCLMAHMLACLFYKISPCMRPDLNNNTFKFANLCPAPDGEDVLDKNGWTTQFTVDKDIKTTKERLEAWRWWFRSLYWVVTTISTTGFGDIAPTTINEMAVGIICIFCGAFILSIILSQFTSGMASLTKTKREYMYQVLLLAKHLKNIGLSEIRQSHVMMYFLTMWNRCRGVPYHKVVNSLPISLQIEVAYALFGKTLNKVPFFTDSADNIFIRQLSKRVIHTLYIPGVYIHKDGDPGDTLFIVYKGVVSGTELTPPGVKPPLKDIYNPGDSFGRFPALFFDGTYKKCYRAETMVEILEVKQSDILHLAKRFPLFKRKLKNYIASRYEPRGPNVSIFERKRRRGMLMGTATEIKLALEVGRHTQGKHPHVGDQPRQKKKPKLQEKQSEKILKQENETQLKLTKEATLLALKGNNDTNKDLDKEPKLNEKPNKSSKKDKAPGVKDKPPADAEKDRAPAEKLNAPIEKDKTPEEKDQGPAKKHIAPSDKDKVPGEKDKAPVEQDEAPAETLKASSEKDKVPAKKDKAPARKDEPPAKVDSDEEIIEYWVNLNDLDYSKSDGVGRLVENSPGSKRRKKSQEKETKDKKQSDPHVNDYWVNLNDEEDNKFAGPEEEVPRKRKSRRRLVRKQSREAAPERRASERRQSTERRNARKAFKRRVSVEKERRASGAREPIKRESREKRRPEEREKRKSEEMRKRKSEEREKRKSEERENRKSEERENRKSEEREKRKSEEREKRKSEESENRKSEEREKRKSEEREKRRSDERERLEGREAEEPEGKETRKREKRKKRKSEEKEKRKREEREAEESEGKEKMKSEEVEGGRSGEKQKRKSKDDSKPEEGEKMKSDKNGKRKSEEKEHGKSDEKKKRKSEEKEKRRSEENEKNKSEEREIGKYEERQQENTEEREAKKLEERERRKSDKRDQRKSEEREQRKSEDGEIRISESREKRKSDGGRKRKSDKGGKRKSGERGKRKPDRK